MKSNDLKPIKPEAVGNPPASPIGDDPLDVCNNLRTFRLSEIREKMEKWRKSKPDKYLVICDFFRVQR